MFERQGVVTLLKEKYGDEDTVMALALEAGADDVQDAGEAWEIYTSLAGFNAVREALENANVSMESAALSMVPKTTLAVDAETGRRLLRLGDALEENDDVQNVYFNFELPDDFEPEE
jgi:transcriptional/translational regulatory protein YebC/TACO1